MFWNKKNKSTEDKVVIFFASDLHGSEVCFKKFVTFRMITKITFHLYFKYLNHNKVAFLILLGVQTGAFFQ